MSNLAATVYALCFFVCMYSTATQTSCVRWITKQLLVRHAGRCHTLCERLACACHERNSTMNATQRARPNEARVIRQYASACTHSIADKYVHMKVCVRVCGVHKLDVRSNMASVMYTHTHSFRSIDREIQSILCCVCAQVVVSFLHFCAPSRRWRTDDVGCVCVCICVRAHVLMMCPRELCRYTRAVF